VAGVEKDNSTFENYNTVTEYVPPAATGAAASASAPSAASDEAASVAALPEPSASTTASAAASVSGGAAAKVEVRECIPKSKGLGVFCNTDKITKGTTVATFEGEQISWVQGDDMPTGIYVVQCDKDGLFFLDCTNCPKFGEDGYEKCIGRFVNSSHPNLPSPDNIPNCHMVAGPGQFDMVIVATKDIFLDEELLFDYHWQLTKFKIAKSCGCYECLGAEESLDWVSKETKGPEVESGAVEQPPLKRPRYVHTFQEVHGSQSKGASLKDEQEASFTCKHNDDDSSFFTEDSKHSATLIHLGIPISLKRVKFTDFAFIDKFDDTCLKAIRKQPGESQNEITVTCFLSSSEYNNRFVEVVSHFENTKYYLLTMPLYPQTLREWFESSENTSFQPRLEACVAMSHCLLGLNELEYAHRDVKLDNFVKDAEQNIRLIDFGRALPFGESENAKQYRSDHFSKQRPKQCFTKRCQTDLTTDVYGPVYSCLHMLLGNKFSIFLVDAKFTNISRKVQALKQLVKGSCLEELIKLYVFDNALSNATVQDVLDALPQRLSQLEAPIYSLVLASTMQNVFESVSPNLEDAYAVSIPSPRNDGADVLIAVKKDSKNSTNTKLHSLF
jgi:hypothetical protein